MGIFCDRLKLGSTAALDSRTGQNKGRYCEKSALIPICLVAYSHCFYMHVNAVAVCTV